MIWKKAFKYPVLIIGIVLFGLYLNDPKTSEYWAKQSRRFIPSTCDALVDRTAPRAPKAWHFNCPGTQLLILRISYEAPADEKFPMTRQKMYKLLANSLVKLAQISNPETMENLINLKVIVENKRINILAKTDGSAVVKFLKLAGKDQIAEHLKLTVRTKEFR